MRACDSASAAFNEVIDWRPTAIVSDIAMPQQDGFEFIRMVREWETENGGSIPAAALTAYTTIGEREKILGAGFQTHLCKPIAPAELSAAVERLLHPKSGSSEFPS